LSFGSIAPQISELRGVKNRPFPLTRHIAYTTACCYRTSREVRFADGTLDIGMLWISDLAMRDWMNMGLNRQRQK